jgi:hypothetical protein
MGRREKERELFNGKMAVGFLGRILESENCESR